MATRALIKNEPPLLVEILYDDGTLQVTGLRCHNQTASACQITAVMSRTIGAAPQGRSVARVWAAGEDSTQAIQTDTDRRLQLGTDPERGRVNGLDLTILWPFTG